MRKYNIAPNSKVNFNTWVESSFSNDIGEKKDHKTILNAMKSELYVKDIRVVILEHDKLKFKVVDV